MVQKAERGSLGACKDEGSQAAGAEGAAFSRGRIDHPPVLQTMQAGSTNFVRAWSSTAVHLHVPQETSLLGALSSRRPLAYCTSRRSSCDHDFVPIGDLALRLCGIVPPVVCRESTNMHSSETSFRLALLSVSCTSKTRCHCSYDRAASVHATKLYPSSKAANVKRGVRDLSHDEIAISHGPQTAVS